MTQCPMQYVDGEAAEALRFVDIAKTGPMPVAGGSMDQTRAFLDAEQLVRSDIARHEAERR